jgi:hypothetical protein
MGIQFSSSLLNQFVSNGVPPITDLAKYCLNVREQLRISKGHTNMLTAELNKAEKAIRDLQLEIDRNKREIAKLRSMA